jgi:hypothetical protein
MDFPSELYTEAQFYPKFFYQSTNFPPKNFNCRFTNKFLHNMCIYLVSSVSVNGTRGTDQRVAFLTEIVQWTVVFPTHGHVVS